MANAEKVIANNARGQNVAELESLRAAKVEELRKLRFKKALEGSQTVSVKSHQFSVLRRDIAVINTVLGEHGRGDLKTKKPTGDKSVKASAPKAEKPKAEKAAKAPKAEAKPKAAKAAKATSSNDVADKPAKKPRAKKGEE